jgi:ubiquinone/menaquinone biosynthesis C-methylase UbiE
MKKIAKIASYLRTIIEKKDELLEPSGGFLPYRVRQKAASLLKGDGRLLDIGAGEGLLLKIIGPNKIAKRFYCIDLDRKKLEQSQARWPDKERAFFIYGDGLYLPFSDNAFDEVTLLNIFLNIQNETVISSLLKEALRVCKTNGTVIFDYRNRINPLILLSYKTVSIHDPELKLPLRGFTKGELKSMLRSQGIREEFSCHPIPSWWKINSPAYLVEIQKKATGEKL